MCFQSRAADRGRHFLDEIDPKPRIDAPQILISEGRLTPCRPQPDCQRIVEVGLDPACQRPRVQEIVAGDRAEQRDRALRHELRDELLLVVEMGVEGADPDR